MPFPDNPFLRLVLVLALFVFAVAFVPLAGSLFLLGLPVVMFVNGIMNGENKTAIAFLIAFSLLFTLSTLLNLDLPVIAIFTMGVAGLFIARIAAQNGTVERIIIYPSAFIVAVIGGYFVIGSFAISLHPWQYVEKFVAAIVDEQIKVLTQFNVENVNIIKDNEKNIKDFFTGMFPSLTVVASILIVWINFLLGKQILTGRGVILPGFTGLALWKSPDWIIWIFIVSGGLSFVSYGNVSILGLNVLMVVCLIYFLQGLAIASFFFQKKEAPMFFRYLFYFLIAVQQILVIPIATVGLFDIWVDFRKFIQKNQTED
jgi:uncharacterized protein YybS (DUF2232 family)